MGEAKVGLVSCLLRCHAFDCLRRIVYFQDNNLITVFNKETLPTMSDDSDLRYSTFIYIFDGSCRFNRNERALKASGAQGNFNLY